MPAATALLLFVTAERLVELWISRRNTKRLLASGAREYGARHYPMLVLLHVGWLAGLWMVAWNRPVDLFWLGVFALLQIMRVWVLFTLGSRWTTRIIVLPSAPLVRSGPYRYVSHPNYLIVIGEIATLPLALGLPLYALVFSILNAIVLFVRVRAENRSLEPVRDAEPLCPEEG